MSFYIIVKLPAGRRGSRPRPAGRLAPAPPAPLPRAARLRAALWELWSPRSAARRRHRRGDRLGSGSGSGSGGSAARAGGVQASAPSGGGVAPAPAAAPSAPHARAQVSGGLPGLRGWRAARLGRSLRDGEEAAGPGGCRPTVPTPGGAASEDVQRPASWPRGGAPRRPALATCLSAAASAVFAARASTSSSLWPLATLSAVFTPPTRITLLGTPSGTGAVGTEVGPCHPRQQPRTRGRHAPAGPGRPPPPALGCTVWVPSGPPRTDLG
ncbi:PREDICTED: verprolin-like [Bison bison bison]|uniref:Verprolin-like n=1 Tax=Bison bison bison TaxID=43346 RepID=A0A6P3GL21_BISBB|nr:PREDICTED: verprolin-like [Bison bison bison]